MQKYRNLCRKYLLTGRIVRTSVIGVCVISVLAGVAGIIISAIKNDFSNMSLYGVLLIIPIALLIGYFIWFAAFDPKRYDRLIATLYDSELSADEVLQIGNEVGIDLFSLALKIRCLKELKMKGVPEWCARDGVLPEYHDGR